jgi:hypothetical protein
VIRLARTKKIDEEVQEVVQNEFSKEQILASEKYANRRDLVDALLDESKKYTMEAVQKLIDGYMKGKVN